MTITFANKLVAVSGSSTGFGDAIARAFVTRGANVHGCDIVDAPSDSPLASHCRVDLQSRQAAADWIAHIEQRGGRALDVLVCNAGGVAGQDHTPFESVRDSQWDEVIAINLGSTLSLCRAVVPGMKRAARGCIVTITSGAALRASMTGVQAYCASKHAVLGLTRQLARELGPKGIRVNSVAPGFVQTNQATRRQWDAMGPEKQRAFLDSLALRRLPTSANVADATVFLASEMASAISGQILSVDGGL